MKDYRNNTLDREPKATGLMRRGDRPGRIDRRFARRLFSLLLVISLLSNTLGFVADDVMPVQGRRASAEILELDDGIGAMEPNEISDGLTLDDSLGDLSDDGLDHIGDLSLSQGLVSNGQGSENTYVYHMQAETRLLLSDLVKKLNLPVRDMQFVENVIVMPNEQDPTLDMSLFVQIVALEKDFLFCLKPLFKDVRLTVYTADGTFILRLVNDMTLKPEDVTLAAQTLAENPIPFDAVFSYDFAGKPARIRLSRLLEQVGLPIKLRSITEVGVVEHVGLEGQVLTIERAKNDYVLTVRHPFNEIELAVFTGTASYSIALLNGGAKEGGDDSEMPADMPTDIGASGVSVSGDPDLPDDGAQDLSGLELLDMPELDQGVLIDDEPEIEQVEEPVTEPEIEQAEEPVAEPEIEQAEEPVAEPETEQAEEPVAEPEIEQTEEPVAEPEIEQAEEPVAEPEIEQAEEPVTEPEIEQAEEPVVEPEIEQAEDPVTEPEIEQAEEPVAEPEIEQAEEPVAEPEIEQTEAPVVEPEIDQAEEPVAEPEIEQTEEAVAKPEIEQTEAPVTEPEIEQAEVPVTEPEIEQAEEPVAEPEIEQAEEPVAEPEVEQAEEPEAEREAGQAWESEAEPEIEQGEEPEAEPEPTADTMAEDAVSAPGDAPEKAPVVETEDVTSDEPTVAVDLSAEEAPVDVTLDEPQAEMDEAPAVAWPAATFTARTSGVNVSVTADEGAFPEGATMAVRRVWDADTLSDIRQSVADDFVKVRRVQLVDITFYDAAGNEIEPRIPVSVVISVSEIEEDQNAVVVHMDDVGQTEVVEQTDAESGDGRTSVSVEMPAGDTEPAGVGNNQTEVFFEADSFSLYAVVVTETISTHYIDASGNTYSVEVSYGPEAGIPSGAKLAVSELTGEAADAYAARAAEALNVNGSQVAYAKALDISILADGAPVQPQTPVSVSIKLLDAPEAAENTNIDVIHFGDEPKSVSCALEGDAVTFETDGFSVYVVTFTIPATDENAGDQVPDHVYTYTGNGPIALSAILSILNIPKGEDMLTVAGVSQATLTESDTLSIQQKVSEGDADTQDWIISISEGAADSAILALTLNDGSTVQISIHLESKLPLTITADSDTKVYDGTALTKDSYTCNGLAEGDSIESVTVTGSQTVVGSSANVPSEAKIVNAAGDDVTDSYAITYANGTLEVTQKAVTITADSDSKVYDGTALTKDSYTNTALAEGDSIESVTVTGTQTVVGSGVNVPSAAKIVNAAGDDVTDSYAITYANGTLEVTQKAVTITADSTEKVYDGYVLSNENYTTEGLAEGDAIKTAVVEGAQTDVGEGNNVVRDARIVNASGTDVTQNYAISYATGTLKVTKKPITITADSASRVYDGTALTAGHYTSTGLADGDVFDSVTVTGTQTVVGESGNVPSNAVIVRPTEDGSVADVNDNYAITYANGTLKVTPKAVTITADSDTKVYDGKPLTKDSYTVEGLAEGDSVQSVTVTGSQTAAGSSNNVPSAAKILNGAGEDVSTSYEIAYDNGTLTVTGKAVTLTANSSVQLYDGSEKTVTGFTVSADGWTLDDVTFPVSVSAAGSGTNEGSYAVTFSGVTPGETTDTSGNYVVNETELGTLQIVKNAPLDKSLTFSGNEAEYTITINPDGLKLNSGKALTLKDTFTNNQSIDYNSVTPSVAGVTYDYSGYTGTFTIPDETAVTITYKTRVSGAAGTKATFGNTAQLGVMQNGSFAEWYSKTVSEERTLTPSGSDIEGSDGVYTLRLFTYAQNHMEQGLGGAVFRLLDANQRPIVYRAGDHAGEPVTFTTGDKGYVMVQLDDGIVSIRKNTFYYLEMITAPVSYDGSGKPVYYQKDNTLYRFLITDDPSYSGNYSYFNGDVLKVRCYPEAAGVNVTKRFSGNYDLTDDQKNQIRFVLQKQDLASEEWVDVEAHTYAEFSYGSMNFTTGRAGGQPLEQAVPYRVIEQYDAIGGVDHSSAVTLTYQWDNQTVQDYTNKFEVNPDHSTYSFSLVFDNTYVDHGLTLVKMNDLTGAVLQGARFTVYKALDGTAVKAYTTDEKGTLSIHRDDVGANYASNTAYYVVETQEPAGYLMPKDPEKIYFYFSENGSGVPEGIPAGTTAVDLTTSYDAVTIDNKTETVKVPVTVSWDVDGVKTWPDEVESKITLYQSVDDDEEPTQVEHDKYGNSITPITLSANKTFDNTTFVNLPARDENGNDITYSVVQEGLPEYYTSYKVSGTGWYVVKNEAAVSVTVKKEWNDLNGNPVTDAGDKQSVQFDLYRTTDEHASVSTRDELEAILRGEKSVMTGLPLSADNNWENTVDSLQKRNANGDLYYYFALEREDSMPRNNEDSYVIAPAGEDTARTLTIKNKQTPTTVIIKAGDRTKAYGQDDPDFVFVTEVQDDACSVGQPVKVEDGRYTVEVARGDDKEHITFTCSREKGEDVGSYAITLEGNATQGAYRVRLDDGTLTITPAQVTVKGTATKVYGNPDPSLVEITGVKEGDTIAYYAYRDIGEQKGSYRITVTGLTKQGNYEITYINDYLTIEPAPVTVTADNLSKPYGGEDPELTVKIDGLTNQDQQSVIKYTISREEGDSVGEYPITVTGDVEQGNYTVTFVNGIFTITGHKVTVRAHNRRKAYGDADPNWEDNPTQYVDIEGLEAGETITFSIGRQEGEDTGEYVITPSGEAQQGNCEVTYVTGLLTIDRRSMTITPDNIVKALTDPVTQDPRLTVSPENIENMADWDKTIVPAAVYDESTRTWTYTYTREGKTEPEFAFTLTRTPGETAGPYIIAAAAFGERPKNYNITYKTGIFTILTTYNVVVNQQTRDLVDYAQNPEYTYTAVLDLSSIGIDEYTAEGFVNNRMTFALPADGVSSKTLPVPSGAKLTVTQDTENPDYTTSVTLDSHAVEGLKVEIDTVNKAASIVVTHERITLPVEARAAQRQTTEGKADEEGAVAVTPLAYLGIPRSQEEPHVPISQSADGDDGFIHALDARGVFNLPEDMYYVPEHASVYNGNTLVARNVQAIRYDAENKAWQYSTDGSGFVDFGTGEQLELFYMPKYICRVPADGESFYTLNEALKHINAITEDEVDDEGKVTEKGEGTIEMLIDRYTMPASDNLSIPANYIITLTKASGLENATILRKPNNLGHMFKNGGTLTLGNITIDGNKGRVTANDAMVLNNGTLTVTGGATLQNASGNGGGAIYANSGTVTVEADATLTDNQATSGGAIYLNGGSISIATNITGNTATYGGAVYVAGGTFEMDSSITITGTATNGGAVYTSGGTATISGTISGTATSGGAVFMIGGTVDLTDGTVSGSTAENGGAFYMEGGTLNISGGTVSNNTARQNGGMLYATGGNIDISGGTLSGNTAQNGNGGAICYTGPGTVTLSGGTLSGNTAEIGLGGAIYQSSGESTLSAGNINGNNKAQNGAAIYTAGGITNFKGVSITGNTASEGGAVGMAAGAKLNFSGNTKVSDNTNTAGEKRNVYLDVDSDEIINVPENLGSNTIGIYVADNVRSTRGEVCCSFGGYVSTTNLSKITDDRGIYTEYNYNNKLYWGKAVNFWVRYLPNGNGFPPNTSSGTQLLGKTAYYPKMTENQIYTLVNLLYDTYYSDKIITGYVYAYTYRNGETSFDKYITSIDWNAEQRQWEYKLHDGTTYTTNNNAQIVIYYADSAYISIVNNSGYDLVINPLTVMGKTAVGDGYGYTAVINNVTQRTLLPITEANLTIPKDCSVRLLFPGAKGSAWSLLGTFDAEEGNTIKYTLDRAGGGVEQTLPTTTTEDGLAFSLNKNLLTTAGGIYEILFGDPTPICKVENGGVEYPFTSLNLAKDYIVSSGLTTAKIEMLLDYQQPKTDILAIPEGYNITLTTAAAKDSEAAEGKTYTYVGDNPTRATISRSSGDMGAAVTSDIKASTAVLTNDECTTSLTVDGIIFDGKALGQGGEGGAIKTANTIVNIQNCDFQGYTATRGGAIYVKWGRLTVDNSHFTNCKILSNQDKTGGGGIWTTAHDLTVRNCSFINCDCTQYPKNGSTPQAGAIFHNIRYDGAVVHPADSQKFPTGFSKNSTTWIEGCTFKDCIATGSGGTVESDAWLVDVKDCTFHGSQTTKSGGNGGALNIYTNDNKSIDNSSYLNVINCWFEDCSATNGNTNGGAVRTLCKSVKISGTTFKNVFSNNTGGALSMTNTGTKLEIYGCTFDNCRANESSGAVYAKATTLTVGDSESYMDYNAETEKYEVVSGERHTTFTDCTSKKFGGVNHDQTGSATITGATFTRCTTTNESAGALYTKTQKLKIENTQFINCTASSAGGAVYNNNNNVGSQVLTNCVFDGCTAGTNGGGAYLAAKSLEVSGTRVQNCEAVSNGGGIYTGTGSTGAVFTECTFTNNRVTASEGKGGALYHNTNGLTFNSSELTGNYAAYGGGIYHNDGAFNLNNSQVSECNATRSGGGIYSNANTFTLNNTEISDCYAVTSGGGIYHNGTLNLYGIISGCHAGVGGGVGSNGALNITTAGKTALISECHAAPVTLNEDGTATAGEADSANLGGGIYKSGGDLKMQSADATISGCTAYEGGGLYINAGTTTFSGGSFIGNEATNNGGAIYKNNGSFSMSGGVIGGSEENANHAQLGAGIFVADGQSITIGGGRITHNVASVGGGVAVGGKNANTQLLFQGAPVIKNNIIDDGENGIRCNVYLNYDTNSIIRTSKTALSEGAYIGVYVASEEFDQHGDYEMLFGTFDNSANLAAFFNDRIYAGGTQGPDGKIKWTEFVCKITDAAGNLLYTDATCETPAVYTTLENGSVANTTSAFGMLSNGTVNLYNANDRYSGAYQIQMLVGDYSCTSQMKLANGSRDITLTTASRDLDECGFHYTGTADHAVVRRGKEYASMIHTDKMSRLVIENITIDGGSENGYKSTSNGGILFVTNGTSVYLNENATLCNSELNEGFNGGGIRMQDGALSYLYINGAEIRNCVAKDNGKNTGYGGGISAKNGNITMNSGLITECYAASGGGAAVVEQNMYMNGGTITGNDAGRFGGGIELKGKIYFTGNPVISGNTLTESTPCNLQLMNNDNTSINAKGLGLFAEIRVYTGSSTDSPGKENTTVYDNHGQKGQTFGTWTDDANLHLFINDITSSLRGMKTTGDDRIYWRERAFLTVSKVMDSDWAADKDVEFDFTVTLVGQETFSGTYGDMTFVNGTATFKLKAGQAKTASELPFDFIHNGVNYTVTENLAVGQTAYTTQYKHNDGDAVEGTSVTGHFGENMSDDSTKSSSVSRVEFTNTRTTDDLTVSKTVTERITGDDVTPYKFTVTLADTTITKNYGAKHYQDQTDTSGKDETVSFTNGVATFQLTHGQSMKILGLPTDLGFKVEEKLTQDQYDNFRTYVTKDSGEEILTYSAEGVVGVLKRVAFRNNRYGLVCKIINDTAGREQLYYRDNNNPDADRTPAIFDELEKAFEAIERGINFFTSDGTSAEPKLRIEMVKRNYTMKRQASLPEGKNVTLGTAKKTDRLYPYPTDADMPAVVTRGFNDGSLFVDNGNLTFDDITVDGGSANNYTATGDGGIVLVSGAQKLTVTERATLRNSATSGNGGAIWVGKDAGLVMNGTITNCQAQNGGGVYAADGFGGDHIVVTIEGSISGCTAEVGNGGAIYAGTGTIPAGIPGAVPVKVTGSAKLTGNTAAQQGGAIYCATDIKIDGTNVAISNNTATTDGGAVYQSSGAFTMTGATISNNIATNGNAGGIQAGNINIANGIFANNKAEKGYGGAIYTVTNANVTISGNDTSFTGNTAKQGGAVYDQAESFATTDITMTGNIATEKGGAVYVASGKSFTMSGGSIKDGNKSSEGAISTGSDAVLNFSGNASVSGNTANDGTTAMNVFLGYHSNAIINASDLTGTGQIGVYVKDGEDQTIYNNHGIANRPFGTGSGENLAKFVNDRDNTLTGVQGANGLIMWPGKDFVIQVYQNKADALGQKTTPVGGAKFSLVNEAGETIWFGQSNASTGLLTIPWRTVEEAVAKPGAQDTQNVGGATFTKKNEDGSATSVTYVLSQEEANADTVRPAGSWKLIIGVDNSVQWQVILQTASDTEDSGLAGNADSEEGQAEEVNRTLDIVGRSDSSVLGDTFLLYDDVKPHITFDPTGGILSGDDESKTRTVTIDFGTTDLQKNYAIEMSNPTRKNSVFRIWSTVDYPTEGDGHKEYKQGDAILFYRDSDDDDVTLYAQWESVVCKITDDKDNLLYVNGSPAVYMSLKEGFDDFNNATFTLNGVKATPRKIKMLVESYQMTEAVELARGKRAELTTADSDDDDGYAGPKSSCVITRADSFDSGSMITDRYSLTLRNIVLDGAVKDSVGEAQAIDVNGGIIAVTGNASNLTLASGAVLRNAAVNGNGGAIYAEGNTTVTVSTGSSITGCQAVSGGGIYADDKNASGEEINPATVNINGGVISGNKAVNANARGGAVYATGKVNMTAGSMTGNSADAEGGALYLENSASEFNMTGGAISGNRAPSGGGVYSNGAARITNSSATISGNAASESNGDRPVTPATGNGGGVYVSARGSLALSAGAIGVSGSPNVAANGSGVYLASGATLTGGSIAYNGAAGQGNGGGLYIATEQNIELNGTNISNNNAANGAGIYVADAPSGTETILTLAKGTISNNIATGKGGGVYVPQKLTLRMTGGTLGGTQAGQGGNQASQGGGIYVLGKFEQTGGTIRSNSAHNGGGAYVAVGGDATVKAGEIRDNRAVTDGNVLGNGAAFYVDGSEEVLGSLRIEAGTVSGNNATGVGGAVYLQDYAQMHISGGTVSQNASSGTNGGAINIAGENVRICLSGSPTIFNNPGNAATTAQKNLVLSVDSPATADSDAIINTEGDGMTGGTVGVYVVEGQLDAHGIYNKPFGAFGDSDTEVRENAKYLVNDRDLALYGVAKEDDDNIYWLDVVCKVTNGSDQMLYKYVAVNGTTTRVYASAVYTTLKDGIAAVYGNLYRKSGTRYATANTGAVKVKMLKDYTLGKLSDDPEEYEIITYEKARDLTLTTAETAVTRAMSANGDAFVYKPAVGAEGEEEYKATLTRAQGRDSMFTVNTSRNSFNVSNLIIDGVDNEMLTEANVNGGAFNIEAAMSSTFTDVMLKNLNATGGGGAIASKAKTLEISASTIENCVGAMGGAVYHYGTSPDTLTVTDTTIKNCHAIGTSSVEGHGGGIYTDAKTNNKLDGVTLEGNTATVNGGGVYQHNNDTVATLTITGTTGNKTEIKGGEATNGNGGGVYAEGNVTITGETTISGNSANGGSATTTSTTGNGGGVYLAPGASMTLAEGTVTVNGTQRSASPTITGNAATANGGAVYAGCDFTTNKEKGAKVTLTGGEITANSADKGGAVYVLGNTQVGAELVIKDGEDASGKPTHVTITGNIATANGAGIYLDEGATLNLEGSPDFGGTGRAAAEADSAIITEDSDGKPIGNFVNIALAEGAQNGQKDYEKFRQDIYMAGYQGTVGTGTTPRPATSIVVTGAITSDAGSIWVAAEKPDTSAADAIKENNHYEMLKQFAVFADGVASDETTVQAFRNAWDDENTGCGADYLTGQDGDDLTDEAGKPWTCIYWTGGFDFVFRKIDGEGEPLDDAEFKLYMAVETAKDSGVYVPAKKDADGKLIPATSADGSDWVAYQQTDKEKGEKGDAKAVSKDIAEADAVTIKIKPDDGTPVSDADVYGDGLAVFEKIPPAVYFIKETLTNATEGTVTIDSKKYVPAEDMYMVDLNGKGYFTIYVGKEAGGNVVWTKSNDPAPTNGFVKGTDGKYTVSTDGKVKPTDTVIPVYTFLNESALSRRVMLQKVDNATTTEVKLLSGAHFHILKADLTEVTEGRTDAEGTPMEYYVSDTSGVYFSGKLPFGTYYLVETVAPTSPEGYGGNIGKVFKLTVKADTKNADGVVTASGTTVGSTPVTTLAAAATATKESDIVDAFIRYQTTGSETAPAGGGEPPAGTGD
ncbi:MAG: Cna B-type domain-containing protein [Oscillospiraceae bacterium]|nr:Cna B-type domain-containing protein [Oscillospiraceae bacterium]